MKVVQMTLDEKLLDEVDALAQRRATTRSALTREALREMLLREKARAMEKKHRLGYQKKPVKRGEFSVSDSDLAWGDK